MNCYIVTRNTKTHHQQQNSTAKQTNKKTLVWEITWEDAHNKVMGK
jgi:hypothetical protein